MFNINEFDFASFQVADGDAVTVDGMLNRFENMVEVKGAVFQDLASTTALCRAVAKAKGLDQVNGKDVFAGIDAGDEVCIRAMDDMLEALATGISIIC